MGRALATIMVAVIGCGSDRPPVSSAGAARLPPACTANPPPGSDEQRATMFFARCLRPLLLENANRSDKVLGAPRDHIRSMLATTEPIQVTRQGAMPGWAWRHDLAPLPQGLIAVGSVEALRSDIEYASVTVLLRTRETPTDGGLNLVIFVAPDGVPLSYRSPGG